MRICSVLLATCCLTLLLPLSAQAQSATLFLRVKGPTGPIAGAKIEVTFGGSAYLVAWTNEEGNAFLSPLSAGTYSLVVGALGYTTATEENVRVDAGARMNMEITLLVEPVELEGIVVQAERIEIDRETVEFSTQIEEAAISLLPVSREARELVALTPGARPDHVWGGASAQANSYRIDGLSMNHPGLGSDLFQPSPYWIESIEVRGLGAGAEVGGFQGGLVDVVTKRGGNTVEGSIRTNVEHDGLTGSNLVNTEIGREVAQRLDVEGEVRGPIVQEKLFYYLSGQRVAQDSKALNHLNKVDTRYAPFSEIRTESRVFGKLTWTPTEADLIEVSTAYTNTRADNYDFTGYEEDGATYGYESPTWLLNGVARKLLGSQIQLEARVNHLQVDERSDPGQGGAIPGITNYTPSPPHNAFGNAPFTLRSAPRSTSGSLVGTFRVRVGEVEHSLRVGGEYTKGTFLNERTRNGGMTWIPAQYDDFDPSDPMTWRGGTGGGVSTVWGGEVGLDSEVANGALFAQSTITLGSRVVFSPGVRWGQWKGWVTPSSGERFQAVEDNAWDPRIGVSVDLTGKGTLVAKAHWGRYHQSLIAQMFDRAQGADVFTNEEFWEYSGSPITDRTRTFTETGRDSLAAIGLFRKVGEAVLNETGRAENYRQPYVEQWVVGLEKKIGSSAKLEFLYSRRSNRDMVSLVDVNRDSNYTHFSRARPLTPEGFYILYGLNGVVFEDFYLPNNVVIAQLRCLAEGSCPEANPIPGLTPADTLGMSWDPNYVLTTAPDGKREFSQLQVNLELARPSWGGSLSYVLTDLKGNLDNVSGYTDPLGYGPGPYVRVNEAVNSYGILGNFSEWEMKASLWGTLPGGLRGGLFWTWRSGDRYSLRYRLSGMGVSRYWVGPRGAPPQYLEVFGEIDHQLVESLEGHYVFIGPRGQLELERQSITDLRLEKAFQIGGRRVAATFDIFNLFRCEAVTEKNNMINHSPFSWQLDEKEWGGITPEDRFAATLDRVRPQTIRLGLMAYF